MSGDLLMDPKNPERLNRTKHNAPRRRALSILAEVDGPVAGWSRASRKGKYPRVNTTVANWLVAHGFAECHPRDEGFADRYTITEAGREAR